MEFIKEEAFDEKQYDTYLRRIHYDNRDAAMYENMLKFLWDYVVDVDLIRDREGLLEEYTHWNLQLIDKCFYHVHSRPYANIRRAYQSVIHLLDGNLEEGIRQFASIGRESFQYDGKAPKLMMNQKGKCYRPVSKLFLLYNYYKVLKKKDAARAEQFKADYPYAFTLFQDGKHEEHDAFYKSQIEVYKDCIFYPVFERIYKLPGGPSDFYLYFEEEKGIPISKI